MWSEFWLISMVPEKSEVFYLRVNCFTLEEESRSKSLKVFEVIFYEMGSKFVPAPWPLSNSLWK